MNLNQTKVSHLYKIEHFEDEKLTLVAEICITDIRNTYLKYIVVNIENFNTYEIPPIGDLSEEVTIRFGAVNPNIKINLIGHKDDYPEYFL